ncbi:MAG: septum formation initiator family protein [Alphaproteobacteria bacterium]
MYVKKFAFVLFFLALLLGVFQTAGQAYRLLKKNETIHNLKTDKKNWQAKNQLLVRKIRSLDEKNIDKDYLEELAREKLGYDYPTDRRLKHP